MTRLFNFIKKNKLYILSFIIPFIIINIIFISNRITPYGNTSLLQVDFYHQYGPMLGELYDRLHNFSSLLYTFNEGLGLPYFRNFLNYLASPFNLIILLFKRRGLLAAYTFIIGIRAAATSTSMVYYLSKKFKRNNIYLIIFGILYAFQAYFIAYYWNIMWMDGLFFLPLIVLGIENIVNHNKWKLYTITLAIMLYSNYFIAYMICIFSCIYFLAYSLYKMEIKKGNIKKYLLKQLKKIYLFGISSLLAGCLVAVCLLPLAKSMASISATGGTMPTSQYYNYTVKDFVLGHFTGVNVTTFASDDITNPNVSCGILTIFLLISFLLNKKIKFKTKICYLFIYVFLIACFFIPQLDYIMQACHVPNDLPYRYSFLYSFILTTISTYAFIKILDMKFYLNGIIYLGIMGILSCLLKFKWIDLSTNMIYINMILLTIYFICYTYVKLYKSKKLLFTIFVIIIVSIDVFIGMKSNWSLDQSVTVFYNDYKETKDYINYTKAYETDKFYRFERINNLTLNDPTWYSYYGMETFSSMAYESMAKLQYHLGMPGNYINSYYYVQTTPIYDLMFNIRYVMGSTNDNERYYKKQNNLYKFNYTVGLGFATNTDLLDWNYNSDDPFEVENDFIRKSTGIDNVLKQAELKKTEIIYQENENTIVKYTYKNSESNMYFYANEYLIDFIIIGDTLYYNNDNYLSYVDKCEEAVTKYNNINNYDEQYIINMLSTGDDVTIYVGYNGYYRKGYLLYYIDNDLFIGAYNILNNQKLNIIEFKESTINAQINVSEEKLIYTSIPYDEGWEVYVDGKKVKTYSLGNSLLTFKIKKGNHRIVIKYHIPLFIIGLLISLITLLILLFYKKIFKFIKMKLSKSKNNIK